MSPPPVGHLNFDHHFDSDFDFLGLKGRLLPCLGVEHSIQLCPEPLHPQHFISFLSLLGFWNLVYEYLPFLLLDLESLHPLLLLKFQLVGLVTVDIK